MNLDENKLKTEFAHAIWLSYEHKRSYFLSFQLYQKNYIKKRRLG